MEELLLDAPELSEDTQKGKYLTFFLGEESYGIEIKFVTEIIGIQSITEVPELPVYIKGIINLRGRIIPVMDVRLRFKKPPKDYNDRTCIIIVDIHQVSIGLIVDLVSEVININDENLVPPPDLSHGHQQKYIKSIGKVGQEVKLILDCDKLMNDEDVESLMDKV